MFSKIKGFGPETVCRKKHKTKPNKTKQTKPNRNKDGQIVVAGAPHFGKSSGDFFLFTGNCKTATTTTTTTTEKKLSRT